MVDYAQARRTMVDCQLRTFDVIDIALLSAMDKVPREAFVPAGREDLAYSDQLVIFGGAAPRTMLTPMLAGRMIQALGIETGFRVLDVAGGLGYSAAVMARLGAHVVALESDEGLGAGMRERLADMPGILAVAVGPLAEGHAERAPYHAILINGAVESRPDDLLRQLAEGGRLVCVQKTGGASQATLYVRSGESFGSRGLFEARTAMLGEFREPAVFVF